MAFSRLLRAGKIPGVAMFDIYFGSSIMRLTMLEIGKNHQSRTFLILGPIYRYQKWLHQTFGQWSKEQLCHITKVNTFWFSQECTFCPKMLWPF